MAEIEKMTKETSNGNRLIAVFDGWNITTYQQHDERLWHASKERAFHCGKYYTPDKMLYHSSWDWFMPAWCKFRDLDLPEKEYRDHFNDIGYAILRGLIDVAFEKLCNGIKWYNEFKK